MQRLDVNTSGYPELLIELGTLLGGIAASILAILIVSITADLRNQWAKQP